MLAIFKKRVFWRNKRRLRHADGSEKACICEKACFVGGTKGACGTTMGVKKLVILKKFFFVEKRRLRHADGSEKTDILKVLIKLTYLH